MSLSEIQNKLYRRDSEKEIDVSKVGDGDDKNSGVEISSDSSVQRKENPDVWNNSRERFSPQILRIMKIGAYIAGAVVFSIFAYFSFFWYQNRAFSEDKVILSINGPGETLSGKRVEYEVAFENMNRADIDNAVLKVSFPENFIPEEDESMKIEGNVAVFRFGRIESGKKGQAILVGKVYAPRGAFIYLKAGLDYVPTNFNSRFLKEAQLGIRTTSSPIIFEINSPQGVSDGGLIRYEMNYRNESDRTFENLRIKAEYPSGFAFSEASQSPLEGNDYWLIGDLSPAGSGKLIIEGSLSGERDEIKKSVFSIGSFENGNFTPFNSGESLTKIVSSPISIAQLINGKSDLNARVGELLRFEIIFKNEGNVGLRDVVITEHLEGQALDFSSLELGVGGNYDSESRTITWRASEYPILGNLLPGQEGRITFSITLKERLPVEKKEDRNFVIRSLARADSPDVPTPIDMNKIVSSNLIQPKVVSPTGLAVRGFYNDKDIANYGPIPPRVGVETSYTMRWSIYNISNDLEGARVSTFLPSGVVYAGVTVPQEEKVKYNSRTNELVWEIGKIEAGTGVILPMKELAFQIRIKPSVDQLGKNVKLLGESVLEAEDSFCNEKIKAGVGEKNNFLQEDEKIPTLGDKVVE